MTTEERFWVKVEKTNGCWLWKAAQIGRPGKAKYGWFRVSTAHGTRAHRFAYELFCGPIPKGMVIRHRCDNRLCVRADHLLLGTHADNIRERDARGRHCAPKGTENGHAKLTNAKVQAIRAANGSQSSIAREFGIDQSSVSRIKSREIWTHI